MQWISISDTYPGYLGLVGSGIANVDLRFLHTVAESGGTPLSWVPVKHVLPAP